MNGRSPCDANKGISTLWKEISCCEVNPSLSTDDFHILRKPSLTLTFTAAPITVPVM
jgi:hypothetical protein